MKTHTIFISYNPNSDFEQTLAVRLHTTGAVNGFRMFLPDRYNSDTIIDNETKSRIAQSDWLVVFSTENLSDTVKQEMQYAWQVLKDKTKILVIYNFKKRENFKGNIIKHFTDIYIDPYNDDFNKIIINLKEKIEKEKIEKENKELKQQRNTLLALLGIGVGLFLLGSQNE